MCEELDYAVLATPERRDTSLNYTERIGPQAQRISRNRRNTNNQIQIPPKAIEREADLLADKQMLLATNLPALFFAFLAS